MGDSLAAIAQRSEVVIKHKTVPLSASSRGGFEEKQMRK